jgi:hypothetical protein
MPRRLVECPGYVPLFFGLMPHRMSSYAMKTLITSGAFRDEDEAEPA